MALPQGLRPRLVQPQSSWRAAGSGDGADRLPLSGCARLREGVPRRQHPGHTGPASAHIPPRTCRSRPQRGPVRQSSSGSGGWRPGSERVWRDLAQTTSPPRSASVRPARAPHLTCCRGLRRTHRSDFKSTVLRQSKLWRWCLRSPPGCCERDDSGGMVSDRATSKEGQKPCVQAGRERAPTSTTPAGGCVSGARSRGWRSRLWGRGGRVKALLSLSVRGSSCRWREPGSANTHTETAENKMCGGASLPSLSGARGARCDSFHCHLSVVAVESPAGVWPGEGHDGTQAMGTCPVLLAGWGNAATSLLSSHAQHTGRDRGETSNICCRCVSLGEVLVWRIIPALENYSQSTQEPSLEPAGCTGTELSPPRLQPIGQSRAGAARAKRLGGSGGCFPACCNNAGCTKPFGNAGVDVAARPQGLTRAEPRRLSSPKLQPAEISPPGESKPRRARGLHTHHWLEPITGLVPATGKRPGVAPAFSPHCCHTQTSKAPPLVSSPLLCQAYKV